ncbi:glycosyltransferase [Prosthecobacter sp.]|uniref:glycosyltransferase n=1 Tax=Prosthecobacter sp. TaxID=1965333 RepID=UPI0037850ADF
MSVLHVIPSLSVAHGGPSKALPMMARALAEEGVRVDVATTDDDGPGRRLREVPQGGAQQREGFRVFYFRKLTEFYKISPGLLLWLFRQVKEYDVVHVHAVFSFATLAAAWACRLRGVPYVVRPLGVLNNWGMNNRRWWLKALSFRLLDKPLLDHAAAIHYTSQQEADEAARLRIRAPDVVIPLGMDLTALQSLPAPDLFTSQFPAAAGRPVILFLSRLDPKKNVELLLEAFALLAAAEPAPLLVVAGGGTPAYLAGLQARAEALGVARRVLWTGHVEGMLKLSLLAAASVYVLPSHSENFGIALLEAMGAGLPCISTPGVALATEAAPQNAVLLCAPEPPALAAALGGLLGSAPERQRLGAAAAQLARGQYSAEAAGRALKQLYARILERRSAATDSADVAQSGKKEVS